MKKCVLSHHSGTSTADCWVPSGKGYNLTHIGAPLLLWLLWVDNLQGMQECDRAHLVLGYSGR